MNIALTPYAQTHEEIILLMIANFHKHHQKLVLKQDDVYQIDNEDIKIDIAYWLQNGSIFMITYDEVYVGYIHIGYREGEMVFHIEDIFIDENYRRRGIAEKAIQLAQEHYMQFESVKAVAIDVIPRNIAAIQLYYKLGFDSLSMVTLRKELKGKNPRDEKVDFMGLVFKK